MTLLEQCRAVLCDAQYYLDQVSPQVYQQQIPLLSNATIGQHSRHFIEFFQCLLAQYSSGTVNYDLRLRNLHLEQDPQFANELVDNIKTELSTLDAVQPLRLESLSGNDFVPTNIAREMIYNIEHTIHHLAIIKVGLKLVATDLALPESFGVAPSTLAYRKEQLCAK